MKKKRRKRWSAASIAQLLNMRDVQQLSWSAIADAFGDTAANCCARYGYNQAKRRVEAMRIGSPIPVRQRFRGRLRNARAETAIPTPPQAAAPAKVAADLPRRPQYFHEADADIAARIRRQGITAGFLGDPPPGRSALDQKVQS